MPSCPKTQRLWTALTAVALLTACGDNIQEDYYSRYYAKCATPRTGKDPSTGKSYPDSQGTLDDEKSFLRAWIDDLYLWYREVPELDPAQYATAVDYFAVLKTTATTPSGKAKDQFHFTYDTADWQALSGQGVEAGYGVAWAVLASRPPRDIVAAYVEPRSPAAAAGVRRGTKVLTVDGVDVERGTDVAALNGGLFPDELAVAHTFVVRDPGATDPRQVSLTSTSITSTPVQNVKTLTQSGRKIGYLTFNDHIATAEAGLADAVNKLRNDNVSDLVIDLRYNGGGYLAIASQLAYMVAGGSATSGKTFELLTYNDRYTSIDPFSGRALTPQPFRSTAVGFSLPSGQSLPTLNLPRVVVITGPGTCSASEALINGLRGIDVQVIQIGTTTCGKPYGFYPQDNCGTTYFSIQFQGVNHKGFGDYADGFVPAGAGGSGVPGCVVPDDFSRDLGDPMEGRLAAAIGYLLTGACPAPTLGGLREHSAIDGVVPKPLWRQNAIGGVPGDERRPR